MPELVDCEAQHMINELGLLIGSAKAAQSAIREGALNTARIRLRVAMQSLQSAMNDFEEYSRPS